MEDNRDIAMALDTLLRSHGYQVEVAHRGSEALELAKRLPPRFALLDLDLPGMDGYELARRLRKDLGSSAPVMIAVSGYGQPADAERSRKAGFQDHLLKPVDLERLLAILKG